MRKVTELSSSGSNDIKLDFKLCYNGFLYRLLTGFVPLAKVVGKEVCEI